MTQAKALLLAQRCRYYGVRVAFTGITSAITMTYVFFKWFITLCIAAVVYKIGVTLLADVAGDVSLIIRQFGYRGYIGGVLGDISKLIATTSWYFMVPIAGFVALRAQERIERTVIIEWSYNRKKHEEDS